MRGQEPFRLRRVATGIDLNIIFSFPNPNQRPDMKEKKPFFNTPEVLPGW
jgi:hypothetical protein